MYLLALDTATDSGGVAVSRNSEIAALVIMKTPLRYDETLLDLIDFTLKNLSLDLQQIGCVAVSSGPGSFTGLRVGLAVAKGIGQPLGLPLAGISTLEALAYRFRREGPLVAPMMDARRQQVYAGLYRVDASSARPELPDQALPPEQWLKSLPRSECLFVGDGAQLYREAIRAFDPEARVLDTDNRILEELCALGYLRVTEGKTVSAEELRAHYVRPSDAEASRK